MHDESEPSAFQPIAIVGIAARLPQARDPHEFWDNLRNGRDCISTLTDEQLIAAGIPAARIADPAYVKAAGLIPDVDRFDAAYFGMSPREAEMCDPQLRLVLESAHQAVEDAGYSTGGLGRDVAVFAACGPSRYATVNVLPHPRYAGGLDLGMSVLNNIDYLATLVSYKFDFRGPSMSVLTACSSSLAAIHLACQALQLGECDAALAAASNVELPYGTGYRWSPGDVRSVDGHCRPFDATSSGTIFTNGAGAVVLKRLDDAVCDGDDVRAVIRGIGLNNDGSDKVSFSAPSVSGQARAVVEAMNLAGVRPAGIDFVEMHATGTALGDPIEMTALATAYRHLGGDDLAPGSIPVGSVKSNVGHAVAASGMAGLLKLVLALDHDELPPTANLGVLNPRLEIESTPFTVLTKPQPWPALPGRSRLAGLSSLGIGGTNTHLVLAEGPAKARTPHRDRPRVVLWSGRDEPAERDYRARLADYFDVAGDRPFADAVATLQQGRHAHPVRGAVVCRGAGEAATRLADGGGIVTGTAPDRRPPVVFAFPGVEHAYPGLAAGLYGTQRVFTETVDECLDAFARHGLDLYPTWLGTGAVTEPLLFAIEYALAAHLIDCGVRPDRTAGAGVGRTVAAAVAGTLTLDAAIRALANGEPAAPPAPDVAPADGEVTVYVGPQSAGPRSAGVACLPVAGGEQLGLLNALATLWTRGVPVQWERLYLDESLQRVSVPGYPFQRQRHWVDVVPPDTTSPAPTQPAPTQPTTPFVSPGWVEATVDDAHTDTHGEPFRASSCLVLLPAEQAAAARSLAALDGVADRVLQVTVGPEFAVGDGQATVRLDRLAEDLDRILDRQRARDDLPDLVVHALGTGHGATDDLDRTFFALLALIQRAARHPVGGRLPAVAVLTDGAVDVSGGESVHPARAAMLAQLGSFGLESPGQRCVTVDAGAGVTAEAIAGELGRGWSDPVVALRGRRRWVRAARPFHARPTARPATRDGGVYVLTGGTGGLGTAVAAALTASGSRPRLALLSRGSAHLTANVEQLRAGGADLHVIGCDVADEATLDTALARVVDECGPIDGVFHLAGIPGRAMLQALDRDAAAEVLRPKVAGTLALRRCLARRAPSAFVVCFSSRAALTGMVGGADYAAGNAFLDAVAAGTPGWLSVNWPAWSEVGMAAGGALDAVAERMRTGAAAPAPVADELTEQAVLSPASTWAMDEHRIGGVPVLPGTAVLDLIIAAYLRVVPGASAPIDVRDLVFQRPIAGKRPVRVRIGFGRAGDAWRVRVLSTPDEDGQAWQEHATCTIGRAEAGGARTVSLDTLMAGRQPTPAPRPRPTDAFAFGPHWTGARRLWRSEQSTLVELELPAAYAAEAGVHAVHPSLLDTATGIGNQSGGDAFYAPFVYQRLTWHRPLPAHCFGHLTARRRDTDSVVLDVDVIAPDGAVVAEIAGLTMRRVRAADLTGGPAGGKPVDAPRPGRGLRPDAGVDLLFTLLGSRTPGQIAVLAQDAGSPEPARAPLAAAAEPRPPDEPARPVVETLRAMWCQVLGRPDVTDAGDFFALGGDSLAAVAVTGRIRDGLGIEIGIGTVFDHPTLAELSAFLEAAAAGPA